MTPNAYDYTLFVKGVFGRNRSVKFESFKLLEESPARRTDDEVVTLAMQKLKDIKLRPGSWYKVTESPVEIRREDDWSTKSVMLFGNREITQGIKQ